MFDIKYISLIEANLQKFEDSKMNEGSISESLKKYIESKKSDIRQMKFKAGGKVENYNGQLF